MARKELVVHEDERSYRVSVERYVYVSATSRSDAEARVAMMLAPRERVTGAVEDFW